MTVSGLVPGSTIVVSESKVPSGYVLDTTPKTIIVKNGTNSLTSGVSGGINTGNNNGTSGGNDLTFENDPKMTLTIHKYIEGTQNEPLAGVAFKITDSTGAAVGPGDGVFYTNAAGEIVIEGLEPGTSITAREIKTVEGFVLDGTPKTVKITAGSQAPELTFWNKRAGELVIRKLDSVTNSSNVMLQSFYWRDTLPAEVRLDSIVTGTYNFPGTYKITYRVNGGEYRTLADNLSTSKNYTLAASATALGLASNERVTEIMFVFGQAPAGFAQVEKPMLYCTAISNITTTSFVNVADVGGTYNGVWVQAVTRWVTTVYGKPTPLPRTGY